MDETTRRRNIVISMIAGAIFLGGIIVVVTLLFFGKPLGFQYANATSQAERVAVEQDDMSKATTAYFSALYEGKKTDGSKAQMSENVQTLERSIEKLGSEAAVVRDEEVLKVFNEYQKKSEKLVKQTKDFLKTLEVTASLREACKSSVFEKLAESESREAGWKVFEACANAAGSFDPSTVPDADYQLLYVMMKKAFSDARQYLTEDESMEEEAMMQLADYSLSAELTDNTVHERLRESSSLASIRQLESILEQKQ